MLWRRIQSRAAEPARPQAEPAFRPNQGGRRMPACQRSRGRRRFGRVRRARRPTRAAL